MPDRLFPLCSLALGLAVASALACTSRAENSLEAARLAIGRGQFGEAISHYTEVLAEEPGGPSAAEALYEIGLIHYLKLRDLSAARTAFQVLLRKYPEDARTTDARRVLARMYERDLRDPDKAVRQYREILSALEDPGQEKAILLSIAECHYRSDQLPEAAGAYAHVIEDYPYDEQSDIALLRLAHIEALSGRTDEVLAILGRLLEETDRPHSRYRAFVGQAEVLLVSERYGEAKDRLNRADLEFPGAPEVRELAHRLERQQIEARSLDDGARESKRILSELQSRIRWGWGQR
jgi:TolA-binding protein